MVSARYKHATFCFFSWFWLNTSDAMEWAMNDRSPLVWPNVWGLIDWLVWSALTIAMFCVATRPLLRVLPGRDRLADLRSVARRLLEWLVSLVALTGVALARAWLYLDTPRIDLQALTSMLSDNFALKTSVVKFIAVNIVAALVFAFRIGAVLMATYEPAED